MENTKRNHSSVCYHLDRSNFIHFIRRWCILFVKFHVYIRFVTYRRKCTRANIVATRSKHRGISLYLTFGQNRRLLLLFSFSLIYFVIAINQMLINGNEKKKKMAKVQVKIVINTHLTTTCLPDLFLSLALLSFFNPILVLPFSIRVYILPSSAFFFCMCVNARTHTHSPSVSFFCSFWWYTSGNDGKNCVCVHYPKIWNEDRHKERNG